MRMQNAWKYANSRRKKKLHSMCSAEKLLLGMFALPLF